MKLPCGHDEKSVSTGDEGTSYCVECEKGARVMNKGGRMKPNRVVPFNFELSFKKSFVEMRKHISGDRQFDQLRWIFLEGFKHGLDTAKNSYSDKNG